MRVKRGEQAASSRDFFMERKVFIPRPPLIFPLPTFDVIDEYGSASRLVVVQASHASSARILAGIPTHEQS